ncbi:MAG TPA: aminotransferase class I/II-fold pyridoxal phosphate-dependent enzyme [Anaerolineales bacterium]
MDFPAPPPVLKALHKAVDHGVMGYELPSATLLETVAARMDRLYGWKVPPEAVVATTGVVSGFNLAARAFCTRQRGYLIQTPVYNEFHEIKNTLAFPQLDAPLLETSRKGILHYEIDWNTFQKQVKKAGMFLLCSPHNPVGKIFTRAELLQMARLCLENDVVIVADEIHSELLLGGEKFTPVARLSREIADHTVTMISPSKTFNVPGLFCGFAVIPSVELHARFTYQVESLRMHVNSLGLLAAQEAFSGTCDPWLADLRHYLTANRDALIEYVHDYLPEIQITRPEATYLAWLDCRELVKSGRIQGSPFDFFLQNARVALSDGRLFGEKYHAYVRLNFGCTRSTLMQALERIRKSIYQ